LAVRFALESLLDIPALYRAVPEILSEETLGAVAHAVAGVPHDRDNLEIGP
jgi:hypothetical protein